MDWAKIATDFEWDGSWRDIYVVGTDAADWQGVLTRLISFEPPPVFLMDGQAQAIPAHVADLFSLREIGSPMLQVPVGRATLNCHFFGASEIEFDLDPREISGPREANALAAFMRLLGEVTGKAVILCQENQQHAVIARYSPDDSEIVWTGE